MAIENKKVKSDNEERGLVISFSNNNYLKGFDHDHDNLTVIISFIHYYAIKRILVDKGSLVNVLYSVIVDNMNIHKIDLKPHARSLIMCFWQASAYEGHSEIESNFRNMAINC